MASAFGSSITGSNAASFRRCNASGMRPMPSRSTTSWISAFENGPSTQPIFVYHPQRKLREVQYARRVATLRDRVCMTAAMLVLEPIFEADLPSELYAYRPGRNAQQAVVEVEELLFRGHPEVVDADLADYFGSIPHAELLKSVSRRIVDRRVLHLIKMWLDCPVEETDDRGRRTRTTEAR